MTRYLILIFALSFLVVPTAGVFAETRKPGETFKDCLSCPEMVVVPAGSFMMGSPKGENGRNNDEGPLRKVTIDRPFAVGKYEITFDEWDACVADGGCSGHKPDDQGWLRGRRPVINVSWYDAKAYVRWLNGKVPGSPYRLLSEAEWEYVARAGTTTQLWWGTKISTDQANYNGNNTYNGTKGVFRERTVAVDSFKPNEFGLYNVHGNAQEWVEDCWHETYDDAPKDGSAWTEDGDCGQHVWRGGSWGHDPRLLRSASRDRQFTSVRAAGFRLSRSLE